MSLHDIKAIIWDLDGTLYKFNPAFINSCNVSAAQAAVTLKMPFSYEQALEIARLSEQRTGFSIQIFMAEHGAAFQDIHGHFHNGMDEFTIEPCHEMAAAIRTIDLPQVILTHATRGWTRRVLTHLGIADLFAEEAVIPLEDLSYATKGSSPLGFERALAILGFASAETLVVEDTDRNLKTARDLGCRTALVHNDGRHPEKPAHVDYLFSTTLDLVKELHGCKAA